MNYKHLAILLTAFFPGLVLAQGVQTYNCTYGELERRVEILHETAASVPCEVHYYKDTEAPGEQQVLWSATQEAGYCEARAEEFIAKLTEWGWNCGQPEAEQAEPEPADDTEALESADDTASAEG